jgi:tetrahydromethanopterin S-methyltransferase subunit C
MKKILNTIAILTASIANIISGYVAVTVGRTHTRLFSEYFTDMELPVISQASVNYTATSAPIILGFIIGIGTLLGLSLILRSERKQWLFPCWLSLSFLTAFLQILIIAIAVSVPFSRITYIMSE